MAWPYPLLDLTRHGRRTRPSADRTLLGPGAPKGGGGTRPIRSGLGAGRAARRRARGAVEQV